LHSRHFSTTTPGRRQSTVRLTHGTSIVARHRQQ
jgi:hypothetical protein